MLKFFLFLETGLFCINFPLRIVSAAFHRFWKVVLLFSFKTAISLLIFCLDMSIVSGVLNFHIIIAAAAKSLQSCPTLCDPIDGSPPGSPVPGILQARTLESVAISFSTYYYYILISLFMSVITCFIYLILIY